MAAQVTTPPLVMAVNVKIASQPKPVSSTPPIRGPSVGTTTITVETRPSMEAARSRSNRSRTMARLKTTPAEAPSACSTRAAIRAPTVPTAIASRLAAAESARPAISTGRRPKRSDSGPMMSCPTASATR